ncbi:MAG TPA: iron uptake transporter deferrochelatase/peroxidase subunit [Myxococcota bacterium]|nr:iron uptake transporter deferrochelatase/peroxidase subunit [Myxococcota bacterium]
MTGGDGEGLRATRRGFLTTTAGLVVAVGSGFGRSAAAGMALSGKGAPESARSNGTQIEPFWGKHQSGIVTPAQAHTYFTSFDLVATKRDQVVELFRQWTSAAARMSEGQPAAAMDADAPAPDSGDVLGLAASRLTLTYGFGAGLFVKDANDRYGLAAYRPEALVDLPKFVGDQLVETRTGGDLSIQACANDAQVAFHAVRELARLAYGVAQIRWVQAGFRADFGAKETPRNLMGFKDGTGNPSANDPKAMDQVVWVGDEGPDWMRGGSYVVARRSRIALEHWDRMKVGFQEQTFGRHKLSGAPLGKKNEFDPVDLEAADQDGNPIIPENSHVRLASAASNGGAKILRRSYSYNDGVSFTAERWPPWRQGMEYDAGLLFVCYQRDPRTGFIQIFDKMSKFDAMNQFVTNTGGGLFACPGGVAKGEFIGQRLFDSA